MSARILVVDDIEANRRLLQAKLEAKYFEVLLAESGPQALEIVRSQNPEIILLDVMMPGMNGYEVCAELKNDRETAHIPVVMVTALSEQEDRVRGLEAGAEDFLTKPVDDFALMSRIDVLMRYNAVASELRRREASGERAGILDKADLTELNRPSSILVIDDNPRSSERLAERLRQYGHAVMTLEETGGFAGDMTDKAELVILSLRSERFDALKLCAHFKMNEDTRSLVIIVIYEPHEKDRAIKAMELGASDMILAPLDDQELFARIRTQSRRFRYIDILRRRLDEGMELAVIDPLTGLHNRRFMMNQLGRLLKRSDMGEAPISVMVGDIDHFKRVNDTYGHEAGDKVLIEVANRLRANVRPSDIVCRHGGEEFIVIMPDTEGEVAKIAAERIRNAVASEVFEIEGVPVSLDITMSGGVASHIGPEETVDQLLKRSDDALYRAKSEGRNRIVTEAA